VAQSNVKLTVDGSQATRALGQVQRKTQALTGAVSTLRNAFLGIGATAVIGQTVKQATSFQKLDIRLKLLTKDTGTYAESLKLVEQAQSKFGLSTTEALDGVTGLQARLAPLGASMDDITATFNGFNTAAILSGASTQEQAGAMRQLTQALGSGVLRGDEFNSIAEQMSVIQKPIADELGITTGELRAFAAQGKITAPVVIRALKKIEKDGGKALKELMDKDPTMVFKRLRNETQKLSIAVGELLTPAVLEGAKALTQLTTALVDFIGSNAGQATAIIAGFVLAVKGLSVALPLLAGGLGLLIAKLKMTALSAALGSTGLKGLAAANFLATASVGKLVIAVTAFKLALAALGIGAVVLAIGAFTTAIVGAINKQREFNKLLKEGSSDEISTGIEKVTKRIEELQDKISKIKKQNDTFELVSGTEGLEMDLAKANDQLDKLNEKLVSVKRQDFWKNFDRSHESLKDQNKSLLISIERAKLKTDEAKKEFDMQAKINELNEKYGEGVAASLIEILKENEGHKATVELIKKKQTEAEKLKEKFAAVGQEIESNIKNNLRDAITGAQSFGQAMTNVLNKIRDKIIDASLDRLFDSIGNKGGGGGVGNFLGSVIGGLFANGGRPPIGKASIVGERGPELFVPSVAGTIVPNNKLGGGGTSNIVNVSVDATGSAVSGNNADAQQLGALIGAAVQNELIKETQPGGLLSR